MIQFLRRIRLPLLFAALLLTSLALMLRSRALAQEPGGTWADVLLLEVVAPLEKALHWPVTPIARLWERHIALVGVRDENEALQTRILELEDENLQIREALMTSGRLERIAAMRDEFEVDLLPTEVVGQDVSLWFRSLLLDRGQRDTVKSGMPVVAPSGLVGLITATSPLAARAMMLLDRRSAVNAIVQRSRARGIVRGDGRGDLEFVFMVRGDDVRAGDVVITSGFGGVYPKGLRIGAVRSVQADRNEILHSAKVEAAVDFGRLEQVFVLLQRSSTMDLLFGADGDHPDETP